MADERRDQGSIADSWRKAEPYVGAVWEFVGAVGLCTLGGWWLDGHFHTTPWMLVGGAVLGFAAGMTAMFKRILSLSERDRAANERERGGGDRR